MFALVVVVLYAARAVLIPTAFAAMLAVLVQPAYAWLGKRLPPKLSLLALFLALAALLTTAGYFFVLKTAEIAESAPKYAGGLQDMIERATARAGESGFRLEFGRLDMERYATGAIRLLGSGLTSAVGLLGVTLLVLAMTALMLYESGKFRQRLLLACGEERSRDVLRMFAPLSGSVQRYLLVKAAISLATGLAIYLGCLALGIDFAFVWGVATFFLNFVPYLGPVAALAPPVAVAFVQHGDPRRGLLALLVLGTVHVISGFIVEPRLVGRLMRLSPFFVLVSVIFWGWFWGAAGVVLAVPLTVALVVSLSNTSRFSFLAILARATS